ncbi:MAG: hypothetical protein R3D32_08015 [Nitratireductor sp.]
MTSSQKLMKLITSGRPEDAEKAIDIVARTLVSVEPYLVRRVASFDALMDPENFVANECETALIVIREQCLGNDVACPLTADHGATAREVILGWMKARIGKPFAGVQSGRVTNAIRREQDERENTCSFDDVIYNIANDDDSNVFDLDEAALKLESMLAEIPAHKAVIFRLEKGIHFIKELTPAALAKFARSHGVDESTVKQIKAVAKAMLEEGQNSLPKIDQSTVANFFGVSDRQIRKIVAEVTNTLTIGEGGSANLARSIA